MNIRRKLTALVAASALAAGVATVTPAPASAGGPGVGVPAVVAIGVGTFALGLAIAANIKNANSIPRNCHFEWHHIDGEWQRVTVCA
jgi:hypothetical protein